MRRSLFIAVLFLLPVPGPAEEPAGYPRLVQSTAWVRTTTQGIGTGWVVDAERRWLVTNFHVVGDQDRVEAFFVEEREGQPIVERQHYLEHQKRLHDEGRAVWGKVIARRESSDLALVQLEALPKGIAALPLAASRPGPGESVLSVGHRHDSEALWLACVGTLRQVGALADGYFWRGKKLAVNAPCLIVQAPILPGDSGGALINEKGEVVGVLSGLRPAPQSAIAIQISEVRYLLAQATKEEPAKEKNAKQPGTELFRKLVASTVWVRPTATEGRAAGFVIDKARKLILTTNSGDGSFDLVDVMFPRFEKDELVAETNAYADRIGLRLDKQLVRGIVLFRDPKRDLAIIELESIPERAQELTLAKEEPRPTEKLHTVSHPSGVELLWLYATGTVRQAANVELVANSVGEALKPRTLLLQIPHQGSSAGGAVVNENGEVVGLLAAKEGTQQQLGYAIAAKELSAFMKAARPMYAPTTASDYLQRGKLLFGTSHDTSDLEEALRLDPKNPEVLHALFKANQAIPVCPRLMKYAERLIAIDPSSLHVQAMFTLALLRNDNPDAAIKECNAVLAKDRTIAMAYYVRSEVSGGLIEDLDKAILYAPDFADAYYSRAFAHMDAGRHDKAIADFSRYTELYPLRNAGYRFRASCFLKTKEYKRAIADREMVIELHPLVGMFYIELAKAQLAADEAAKAISSLLIATRCPSTIWNSERMLAKIILEYGDEIRIRWTDDHAKRSRWYEQALRSLGPRLFNEANRPKVVRLLESRPKDWDDQRWGDELEKAIRKMTSP